MTIRPPEYKPPPRRAYTNIGWVCAALLGPALFLVVWIYCAVTYGILFGFFLGWIPALFLTLVVAVAMIYLWPLVAAAILYFIYRDYGVPPRIAGLHRSVDSHLCHRNSLVVAYGQD
jgi:hypothetical protein